MTRTTAHDTRHTTHHREQSKFRDFFTKELNETRAGLVAAKKEQKSLEGKRDRNVTRINTIASGMRFSKKLGGASV
jgi:hypothetical protein